MIISFDLKKYRRVVFHYTKDYAKLEEKLTCGLENDMRIWQISIRARRSIKIGTLLESFCPKSKIHQLKI